MESFKLPSLSFSNLPFIVWIFLIPRLSYHFPVREDLYEFDSSCVIPIRSITGVLLYGN